MEKKLPESFEYSFAARNICDDKTRFFPNLGKIYLAREFKLVAIDTNILIIVLYFIDSQYQIFLRFFSDNFIYASCIENLYKIFIIQMIPSSPNVIGHSSSKKKEETGWQHSKGTECHRRVHASKLCTCIYLHGTGFSHGILPLINFQQILI